LPEIDGLTLKIDAYGGRLEGELGQGAEITTSGSTNVSFDLKFPLRINLDRPGCRPPVLEGIDELDGGDYKVHGETVGTLNITQEGKYSNLNLRYTGQ